MIIGKNHVKNQILFLLILFFLYFLLPIVSALFLGENFYIFSRSEPEAKLLVLWAFFLSIILVYLVYMATSNELRNIKKISSFSKKIFKIHFYIFILLMVFLLLNGIYQRITVGADRNYLLSNLHSFLLPGVSVLFIGAIVYIARFFTKEKIFLLVLLFVSLDALYLGKKFSFIAIALLLYHFDFRSFHFKKSKNVIFYIGSFGFIVIISTFVMRQIAANDILEVSLASLSIYSLTSEFTGVYATVGHAIDNASFIHEFRNIDSKLSYYYIDSIGHGLALHPISYFIILNDSYWYLFYIAYFFFIFLLIKFFSKMIGSILLLIIVVNSIHFFRHGPDIFIWQLLQQSVYITIIIHLPKILSR